MDTAPEHGASWGNDMAITFNPANMTSAAGKAGEYNRLLRAGYSDAAIRQAAERQFGAQSAGDWSYLQGLAQQQSMTPQQLANLQALTPQQKAQAYLGGLAGGKTDEQIHERNSRKRSSETKGVAF